MNPRNPRRPWTPTLGAWPVDGGFRFRVWAPEVDRVELVVERLDHRVVLTRGPDGDHTATVDDARPGDRYRYVLDGRGPFPDPASRSQPEGVHGPSEVVDPTFGWTDQSWRPVPRRSLVVYELHVGTFTPAGDFQGVIDRLAYLADLGVTAIELMPVADWAGDRNWGYDGVSLFAPAHRYGRPEALRRLVDRAHGVGLAVLLDVVYNHFGPDGAYHAEFSPAYFSQAHQSPWGPAINFDGAHSAGTRRFVIENALYWLHEFHVDGLRLDATHAIVDESPIHVVAELTTRVRASARATAWLMVEDGRNLASVLTSVDDGGWGMDGVWADDLHHQLRRATAGDRDGYFVDYQGTIDDIATCVRRGWFFCGAHSSFLQADRGTDPTGLPLERFVVCLQNHDQVGNRAFGDRLHHQIDPAVYRALVALLCCLPETPLLFMGQEWAARTPFLYFTDHHESLGRAVTEGRRREFGRFRAFADAASRARIPDPQAASTFVASRLVWAELDEAAHARVHRLHRALLRLRRAEPALHGALLSGDTIAGTLAAQTLGLTRTGPSGERVVVVCHLAGKATVRLPPGPSVATEWSTVLTTEDPSFVDATRPVSVGSGPTPEVAFDRPGTVVLRVKGAA